MWLLPPLCHQVWVNSIWTCVCASCRPADCDSVFLSQQGRWWTATEPAPPPQNLPRPHSLLRQDSRNWKPLASPFSVREWPMAELSFPITIVFILNSYSNHFVVKIYFFPKMVMGINEALKNQFPWGWGDGSTGLCSKPEDRSSNPGADVKAEHRE